MYKHLCFLLLAALPWLAHAQAAIDGVWKTDPKSFTSPNKPSQYLLKDGVYRCDSCAPKITVAADGLDQPVRANPYLDAMSVKILDEHTVEITTRSHGKILATGKITVSPDGKTMMREFRYIEANGSSSTSIEKYTRIGAVMAKGAHAMTGSWKFANYEWYSDETATFKTASGTLSMNGSDGMSYDAPLDGTRVPVKNSPGADSVSVKSKGSNTWEETSYRQGKVIWVSVMTVSPDGEKMKVTYEDKERNARGTYSMTRQ
jgi:hypothetical protein